MSKNDVDNFQTTGTVGDNSPAEDERAKLEAHVQYLYDNLTSNLRNLKHSKDCMKDLVNELKAGDRFQLISADEDKTVNAKESFGQITKSLEAAFEILDAQKQIVNMILSDLHQSINHIEKLGASNWQTGAVTQVLISLLKSKEIITDEELQAVWNKVIPDAIQELQKSKS